MNTIIIHPNNRVARTPAHDLSAALIAPVSRWYRKPTPWWVDTFEEVSLHPIVETDEIVEETEEREATLEEIVLDNDLSDERSASKNVEYTSTVQTDIALEHSQQGEHSIEAADIFEDKALDNITSENDLLGMEKDGCYDNIDFFEDVILVDNDDEEADDDDTLMDITFTGKNATFRLQVPLSIVATGLDSEDEGGGNTIQFIQ